MTTEQIEVIEGKLKDRLGVVMPFADLNNENRLFYEDGFMNGAESGHELAKKEIERLKAEKEKLFIALKELIDLRQFSGNTEEYEERKNRAWNQAEWAIEK